MITEICFYVFAIILILSALRVITAKNPVHAVLFLVLCFITAACLWLMLDAEFLALSLIMIYVGAVMILFLFVVMMLDIDSEILRSGFWKHLPLVLILGVIILVEMIVVLYTKPIIIHQFTAVATESNSYQLGWLLYTKYAYPVELASITLLLGLIIAVALTLRTTNKQAKYQNISKQVATNSRDRITLVNIKNSSLQTHEFETVTTGTKEENIP